MNILGIGIDIVEIKRIEDALNKNKRFLDKLFTKEEIKYFESRNFKIETIAGNFAAKEAISKAMGTGIRNFNFIDISNYTIILLSGFTKSYSWIKAQILRVYPKWYSGIFHIK